MLKRKENNKNKDKKSQLLIVGSLLILLGLGVIIGKIYLDIRSDNLEKIANNIYRKVTIPNENKAEKSRMKNDTRF